jgi:lysyl-tRNA synthetase class 1
MDGLQGADNVLNTEMLTQHLGKPLTKVPDRSAHPSFGGNNARLRAFLDTFGFEHTMSDAVLQSGLFDALGVGALRRGDEHHAVREERAQPFAAAARSSGIVLQVPVLSHVQARHDHLRGAGDAGTVHRPGHRRRCKLQ